MARRRGAETRVRTPGPGSVFNLQVIDEAKKGGNLMSRIQIVFERIAPFVIVALVVVLRLHIGPLMADPHLP